MGKIRTENAQTSDGSRSVYVVYWGGGGGGGGGEGGGGGNVKM